MQCSYCPRLGHVPPDRRFITGERPRLMVVAQSPGRVELRKGIPLIGPSGSLLRVYILEAGLHREFDIWYTNVLKHRPSGPDPREEEILACLPYLWGEMLEFCPTEVLCVGAEAARFVGLFPGSIGHAAGKARKVGRVTFRAVYHPAYMLRLKGTIKFRPVESQLRQVLADIHQAVNLTPATYTWQYTDQPIHAPQAAIDTEYVGDPRDGKLRAISIHDGTTTYITHRPPVVLHPIFHNAIVDLPMLVANGWEMPDEVDDTIVLAHLKGEPVLGLKPLARKHLNVATVDYGEATGWNGWMAYAAQDAVLTWQLFQKLGQDLPAVYTNISRRLLPVLARMSMRGFTVDQQQVKERLAAVDTKLSVVRAHLDALVGPDFNPNSPIQVKAALEERRGRHLPDTEAATLRRLDDPLASLVLAHRKCAKLRSTYLVPMLNAPVVRSFYDPVGTETGRLSSYDMNLQNLPPMAKACLVARPGMTFVTGDYKQIELVFAAFLSWDLTMMRMLNEGRDLHSELCRRVYGMVTKGLRDKAKAGNFERLYGGGRGKLAIILHVPYTEAVRIFDAQAEIMPDFLLWSEEMHKVAWRQGYVETLFGQRRYLTDLASHDEALRAKAAREAVNTPIQGSVGNACNLALIYVDHLAGQLGGAPINAEHDSITLEVPIEYVEDAKDALRTAMLEAVPPEIRKVLPVGVDMAVSTVYG